MSQSEFSAAFEGSPMKGSKLRGLRRNAPVLSSNVATPEDVPVLLRALDDPDVPVRRHAAWALRRVEPRKLD